MPGAHWFALVLCPFAVQSPKFLKNRLVRPVLEQRIGGPLYPLEPIRRWAHFGGDLRAGHQLWARNGEDMDPDAVAQLLAEDDVKLVLKRVQDLRHRENVMTRGCGAEDMVMGRGQAYPAEAREWSCRR